MITASASSTHELAFLQSLTERELCELVLIPLLSAQGYTEIRYTHGKLEQGKDIVFADHDALAGKLLLCATVKQAPLTGAVTGSRAIREVYFQVKQALTQSYLNPFDAQELFPKRVYVITPYQITNEATESIKGELHALGNHVFFIDGPNLLAMIYRDLPDLLVSLVNSELRYLHQLASRAGESAHVMAEPATSGRSLTDLYTGGRLTLTTKELARLGSFYPPSAANDGQEIELFHLLEKHRYLAIVSDAGAGKTTCLKRITLELIEQKKQSSNPSTLVPLLIPLHRLPPTSFGDEETFFGALIEYLATEFGFEVNDQRASDFALLLDGFDEVSNRHQDLASQISTLSRTFPRVIVTSRPSRVPGLNDHFTYASLVPFSDQDIETFLLKWFNGRASIVELVMSRIRSDHNLLAFCRNPLLLSMYASLANRKAASDLPTRKTEVYNQVVTLLVEEWDRIRGISSEFDPDEKRFALESLAFRIHQEGRKTFDESVFESTVAGFLETRGRAKQSSQLLEEILFRTSLIRRLPRSDNFEFTHLSFQEFFAAQWMQRTLGKPDVQRLIFEEWWRNSVRFYCGLTRSLDGLLPKRKTIARGKVPWLAEYLAEADFTSARTRSAVLDVLDEELAFSRLMEDREIEYAAQSGDEIIRRMTRRLWSRNEKRQPQRQPLIFNYLRVLLSLDSKLCRQVAATIMGRDLPWGGADQKITCLMTMISKVRVDIWSEWALRLLEEIQADAVERMEVLVRQTTRLNEDDDDVALLPSWGTRMQLDAEMERVAPKLEEVQIRLDQVTGATRHDASARGARAVVEAARRAHERILERHRELSGRFYDC